MDKTTLRQISEPMPWDPDAHLAAAERLLLDQYQALIEDLNRRVNLFARSAVGDTFHDRHILHALCLRRRRFPAGSTVVDWGSGGGIPGIPLAICHADVRFILVEAIGKKAAALHLIRKELGLSNVEVWNGRAEAWDGSHDYAVSRGTASLESLWRWTHRGLSAGADPAPEGAWRRGLVCLKGGGLSAEVERLRGSFPDTEVAEIDLFELTGREVFREKLIVQVVEQS